MESAPTCAARGVELAMSQNRTVTILRSPCSTEREVRIILARCGGVYAAAAGACGAEARSRAPHWPQKFAASGLSNEHAGHFTDVCGLGGALDGADVSLGVNRF